MSRRRNQGIWIVGLTIAAFLFAHVSAVIIRRNLDAPTSPKDAAAVATARPEAGVHAAGSPEELKGGSDRGVKVEQVSETEWIVERSSLLAGTRDLNRLLMQARTEPYREEGKIIGFRFTMISHGSIYERIGLQAGDVLREVNKRKLDDPAKMLALYREMRGKRSILLLLSRDGQARTFHYVIR